MQPTVIGMLSETPIHVGVGQVGGVIDLPVARDQCTDLPILPSSGLKGALRETLDSQNDQDAADLAKFLFGKESVADQPGRAGALSVTEGILLLLPIRSLTESFRWVTSCRQIRLLERLVRMLLGPEKAKPLEGLRLRLLNETQLGLNTPESRHAITAERADFLSLEERHFMGQDNTALIDELAAILAPLIGEERQDELKVKLTIVSEQHLSWFGANALSVMARNALDKSTKASIALWHEESVPCEALFAAGLLPTEGVNQDPKRSADWLGAFMSKGYLRVGGNETIGQGWLSLRDFSLAGA